MAISKKNIANEISKVLNLNKIESQLIVDSFFLVIKKELNNKNIKVHNFGAFKCKISPERIGRNPKTKEEYVIKPRRKISFKPSSSIKKTIN